MARKRFKWTRKAYKHAAWMARFYGRHIYELPERPPWLLQKYFDLWDSHPQNDDPLLMPLSRRMDCVNNEVPF